MTSYGPDGTSGTGPGYGAGGPQGGAWQPGPPQPGPPQPGYPQSAANPPGFGQPGGGFPAGPPVKRPTPVGAIVMIILGGLLMVGGLPVGALTGTALMIPAAIGLADDFVAVSPAGTIEAEAGDTVSLYLAGGDPTGADCRATGPDGADAAIAPATISSTVESDGLSYELIGTVEAASAGTYTIECDTSTTSTAFATIGSPGMTLAAPVIWGAVIGGIVSLVGIVLLVIGIVKLVRRNRSARGAPA